MMRCPHCRGLAGIALWLLLASPPLERLLTATMLGQMLLQLPLLAWAGWATATLFPTRLVSWLERGNRHGVSGLLLASLVGMVWMVPRVMDASLVDPLLRGAKLITVPLLVGAAIAVSWPLAGFVVRGVVMLEVIATALRLGWLYLISPVRLCGNYLLTDQRRLGLALLILGLGGLAILVARLLWGRVNSSPAPEKELIAPAPPLAQSPP